MSDILRQVLRFIFVILLQVLILNHITLYGFMCPYLYIVCILMLPVSIENWLRVIISFALGLIIDYFSGTLGLHAASCVFMGAAVPFILQLFYSNRDLRQGVCPDIAWFGMKNFILFVLLTVSVHHLVLFFLNVFSIRFFFHTFVSALLNIVFTSITIILYQMIFHSRSSK